MMILPTVYSIIVLQEITFFSSPRPQGRWLTNYLFLSTCDDARAGRRLSFPVQTSTRLNSFRSDVPTQDSDDRKRIRLRKSSEKVNTNYTPRIRQEKEEREEEAAVAENRLSLPEFQLPPAPEDLFVLVGDLLSLSVYSFSDHFFCQDLAQFLLPSLETSSNGGGGGGGGGGIFSVPSIDSMIQAPVWLDRTVAFNDQVLTVLLRDAKVVHYSPILQPMGLAATLLASSWLLSGWYFQAFAYRNTLDCSTSRTLCVTTKAWIASSLIVSMAVGLTSAKSPEHWWQAFTVGDVDYIWDSLTVLLVWRYMASSMLGNGGNDDDNGDAI